jgi:hypothetical protein
MDTTMAEPARFAFVNAMATLDPAFEPPAACSNTMVPGVAVVLPLLADVALPFASNVTVALVYVPAPTPEVASVVASVPEVVTSPVRSPLVIEVEPENLVRLPDAGLPVVVTVPEPAEPFAAAVMRPLASTVRFVFV